MVFKGNIEQITDTELRIQLRATQRNVSVFPPDSRYAVEHDTMDTTFRNMYLGLSAFLDANTERRDHYLFTLLTFFQQLFNIIFGDSVIRHKESDKVNEAIPIDKIC